MPRTLKTYQTSAGFFDLAVAAPSMKAALEAWGSRANLFHQGFARETQDAAVVAATMARPGVVLRRPVGSNAAFREDAALPTDLPTARPVARPKAGKQKTARPPPPGIDEVEARAAQISFERERQRREKARLEEEQEQERALARRERAIKQAQAALDKARAGHERKRAAIDDDRAALELRERAENARWAKQRTTLEAALRLAHRM